MNSKTKVKYTKLFSGKVKRLAKKYISLPFDLEQLHTTLIAEPHTGIPLGNSIYKIRLAIKSKGKGKSGERGLFHT